MVECLVESAVKGCNYSGIRNPGQGPFLSSPIFVGNQPYQNFKGMYDVSLTWGFANVILLWFCLGVDISANVKIKLRQRIMFLE